jgi:hypothetical protein
VQRCSCWWSELTATACVEVRVANLGNVGDGTSTLWADFTTSNGDESLVGPRITLSDMASGATITKTLAWKNELPTDPDFFFRGLCDPGLRS